MEHPRDPAAVMTAAGIVQEGDPRLTTRASPFVLPAEADAARTLISELEHAAARVRRLHVFSKGIGIAAPQIDSPRSDRAAAIVIPPHPDADLVVLLNPEILDSSPSTDEQYEGCLSFFGVRGLVPRPRAIEVAHTGLDGRRRVTGFRDGVARLVAHEIDHLDGLLYRTRMRDGEEPIPYDQYQGNGTNWTYR